MSKQMIVFFISLAFLISGSPAFGEDVAKKARIFVTKAIKTRQQTQISEDDWVSEKDDLEAKYEQFLNKNKDLLSVTKKLGEQISDTNGKIDFMENKISEISRISKELSPFLDTVYTELSSIIQTDLPFLLKERTNRLTNLRKILDDSKKPVSEKYRKIMEALFIETEYGSTIETYPDKITTQGKKVLVNIFRLGRLSLFYQSLDKKTTGYFDTGQSMWITLPGKYNRDINTAIEIAAKRRIAQLLELPLGRISVK